MVEELVYQLHADLKTNKTKTFWLTDFMSALRPPEETARWEDPYGDNLTLFETGNTTETRNIVSKIDASIQELRFNTAGELTSEMNISYESTDFSPSDLKLRMIIRSTVESEE